MPLLATLLSCVLALGPPFSTAATTTFLNEVERQVLAECRKLKIDLPSDFVNWVHNDPIVRKTVYGTRSNPLPVLLGLRSLEIDLGEDVVRRDYTQLALAFAVQGSYEPLNGTSGHQNDNFHPSIPNWLPDVKPRTPLKLVIRGDPRVTVNTKDPTRPLDAQDHIINFLEDHEPIEVDAVERELPPLEYDSKGIAKPRRMKDVRKKVWRGLVAADVISSAALQAEFNEYMRSKGQPQVQVSCGDNVVSWFSNEAVEDAKMRDAITAAYNLFNDAYKAKGRVPAERDASPTASESMAWFVRNDQTPFTPAERAVRGDDRFPLNAPWPMLMMLAIDSQPLREREEIYQQFVNAGEMRTYGEYTGGIAQQGTMQAARRLAPFAFSNGSIQMMWKDGGVCGTMASIGSRTHRTCGVPAATAGQPGHCALVRMKFDKTSGKFCLVGEQFATGGDEVTGVHAWWNYDDVGGSRQMIHHSTICDAVNNDFEGLLDAMVMQRIWDRLSPQDKAENAQSFLREGLRENAYAMAVIEGAFKGASDWTASLELLEEINDTEKKSPRSPLFQQTIRTIAGDRIMALPEPRGQDAEKLVAEMARLKIDHPELLARTLRMAGGDTAVTDECKKRVAEYIANPDRVKSKTPANNLTRWLKGIASNFKSTKVGKAARAQWATAVLQCFKDNEVIVLKKKKQVDPVVLELCKLAGTKPPPLDAPPPAAPGG